MLTGAVVELEEDDDELEEDDVELEEDDVELLGSELGELSFPQAAQSSASDNTIARDRTRIAPLYRPLREAFS